MAEFLVNFSLSRIGESKNAISDYFSNDINGAKQDLQAKYEEVYSSIVEETEFCDQQLRETARDLDLIDDVLTRNREIIDEINRLISEIQMVINEITREIDSLVSKKSSISADSSLDEQTKRSRINELDKEIADLRSRRDDYMNKKSRLVIKENEIERMNAKLGFKKDKIKSVESRLKSRIDKLQYQQRKIATDFGYFEENYNRTLKNADSVVDNVEVIKERASSIINCVTNAIKSLDDYDGFGYTFRKDGITLKDEEVFETLADNLHAFIEGLSSLIEDLKEGLSNYTVSMRDNISQVAEIKVLELQEIMLSLKQQLEDVKSYIKKAKDATESYLEKGDVRLY